MKADILVSLLRDMAELVDKPGNLGGGAILLEAAETIIQQRRLIPPSEPTR